MPIKYIECPADVGELWGSRLWIYMKAKRILNKRYAGWYARRLEVDGFTFLNRRDLNDAGRQGRGPQHFEGKRN